MSGPLASAAVIDVDLQECWLGLRFLVYEPRAMNNNKGGLVQAGVQHSKAVLSMLPPLPQVRDQCMVPCLWCADAIHVL